MSSFIKGLHHVTAIAGSPQANVDFYVGVLGLRFIKKTVNFDAPDVYHLYYGDEAGSPGSVMTFFPFGDIQRGRRGAGQMSYTAFSVPVGSLDYWRQRLERRNVVCDAPQRRFDEEYIRFEDNDGLGIELVAVQGDERAPWSKADVPPEYAIRGFYSATLPEVSGYKTIDLLTGEMEYRSLAQDGDRHRFETGQGGAGTYLDIVETQPDKRPLQGAGTVHHVAFSVENDDALVAVRERLVDKGYNVTPVIDRQYFHSIYYREPGGILFEIAANPPGFTIDEPLESLANELKLPAWYESKRELIEAHLPPLHIPTA